MQSDSLLNNGLPGIPFGPSSSFSGTSSSKLQQHPSSVKHKRRKPLKERQQRQPANPKTLLSMMNHNIMTMRRVRHTHAKFAALTASSAPTEDEEQGAEGGGVYGSGGTGGGTATRAGLPSGIGSSSGLVGNSFGLSEDDGLDDKIDEEPWTVWRGKKGKVKNLSGVEIGEANATDCLHWAGNKILEHVGFQGMLFGFSSKLALSAPFLFVFGSYIESGP